MHLYLSIVIDFNSYGIHIFLTDNKFLAVVHKYLVTFGVVSSVSKLFFIAIKRIPSQ